MFDSGWVDEGGMEERGWKGWKGEGDCTWRKERGSSLGGGSEEIEKGN